MPRGAEYDNGVPQSDNAIEAGETKVHGTGSGVRPLPFPNPPPVSLSLLEKYDTNSNRTTT
jgi:hypothetical protein